MTQKKILIDMDGVVVDFDRFANENALTPDEVKRHPGAYLSMRPIPGALDGVRALIAAGHDVWLATKPATGIPEGYADKVRWVMEHLPELTRKIIFTADKGMLKADVLIDDRPWRANCEAFDGRLIRFTLGDWPYIVRDYASEVTP